jgi:hypothetical protein
MNSPAPLPEPISPALFPLVDYAPSLPDCTAKAWGMYDGRWTFLTEVRRGGAFERYVNGELVHVYRGDDNALYAC